MIKYVVDLNIKVLVKSKKYNKNVFVFWFESIECFLCFLDMGNYVVENNSNYGEFILYNKWKRKRWGWGVGRSWCSNSLVSK